MRRLARMQKTLQIKGFSTACAHARGVCDLRFFAFESRGFMGEICIASKLRGFEVIDL